LRYQVYEQVVAYHHDPEKFAAAFADGTLALAEEIQQARQRLPLVVVEEEARELGLGLIHRLGIDSNRAEISLFEAARAHAAADERTQATVEDVRAVAFLALRQRQSPSLARFFAEQAEEDSRMQAVFAEHVERET
jgi:magnesium chelatase subunit I